MKLKQNRLKSISCGGRLVSLNKPLIMGIVNITPDSFYAESRTWNKDLLTLRIQQMANDGVDIIDVGAYSSRPGALSISEKEELDRLIPALSLIKTHLPNMPLSIDTFRSGIVQEVFRQFGAVWVNDISASALDTKMLGTVGRLGLPYIAMHMRGTPTNMQSKTNYQALVPEICMYFAHKYGQCIDAGIHDVIIDPGFGFAKTLEQNHQLLQHLDDLHVLNLPILVGLSRKSMLYKALKLTPEDVLPATIAAQTIALNKGAHILRVHDVKEAVQQVRLLELSTKFANG